jgi:predicted DNA-binding protein
MPREYIERARKALNLNQSATQSVIIRTAVEHIIGECCPDLGADVSRETLTV